MEDLTLSKVLSSTIRLHLSSSCFVTHKASTESFHFSRLAGMVFTSSHDCHAASFFSLSTVSLHVVLGLPLLRFPSGAQVIAMLQSLFWSCLSIWPIIDASSLLYSGFMYALFSSSLLLTRPCHWICRLNSCNSCNITWLCPPMKTFNCTLLESIVHSGRFGALVLPISFRRNRSQKHLKSAYNG